MGPMDLLPGRPAARNTSTLLLLIASLVQIVAADSLAAEWRVLSDRSLFAVVTHKEGLGARFAHEHLVVAERFDARLERPVGDLATGSFELSLAVADLAVDAAEIQTAWQDRLLEWGALAAPFAELSDKDRAKIRSSMLAADQLDAEHYPEIRARASNLRPPAKAGDRWSVDLSLTVRGRTVERQLAADVDETDGTLTARVVAPLRFTELGIEPYWAMLGAVRVADEMHLVVVLAAKATGALGASSESPG